MAGTGAITTGDISAATGDVTKTSSAGSVYQRDVTVFGGKTFNLGEGAGAVASLPVWAMVAIGAGILFLVYLIFQTSKR